MNFLTLDTGAPSEARTRDPLLKRQVLLPTELQAQIFFIRFIYRFSFHHFFPFLTFYKYYIKIFIKNQFYSFYLIKLIFMVPKTGLEPVRISSEVFETSVSAIPPLGHNIADHP